ncbi:MULTISPECIES: phage tail protein [Pseudomonas syringae group]|uniref:Tail protein n=2 Tax=Pseudomonas syringae group TaxID=136849 RepID=A0A2K4WZC7_PSESX|nr:MULTISPECIES: tail fiber protein [Pseudomonas syringae group]AVB13607.1 phage tail protein [Pseudomonas amygdali pv. morsprunorum]KWS53365.1 phage tail protein [Pseudomonas amygdali pv. morsprunorum]KWS69524.1 phage tail protein [Pseudomonas amygdali pv. morsprunorum]MBD1107407.1 tail fiber protein [Pseudomonas amygdali pv. morsprunorum]MBI6730221.1 tail fiber protein [Pseudomonas amygdali]
MEVFMGSIMTFGFPFAPAGWMQCNGQTLNISQYNALYTLLGVIYGGNPSQNFMLPNLQGRVPINQGTGVNLTNRVIGSVSGVEKVTVAIANMPAHVHQMSTLTANTTITLANPAVTGATITPTTDNAFIGASTSGPTSANIFSPNAGTAPVVQKGVSTAITGTMQPVGGSLPIDSMNPFLVVNFSIALQGLFPTRD